MFNQQKFDEKLRGRCHDNNKFILLLQEGNYPYEYVDDLEKLN